MNGVRVAMIVEPDSDAARKLGPGPGLWVVVEAKPGETWVSRAARDRGQAYWIACRIGFRGRQPWWPWEGAIVVEEPDGEWVVRALTVDGCVVDALHILDRAHRIWLGFEARAILETDTDATLSGRPNGHA